MARDVFHMTVSLPVVEPDLVDEVLHPLDNIRVSVYLRGTTTTTPIYQRGTGATQGPTPESGTTSGPNPFTTGVTGDIEFWTDGPKEVDVAIHDLTVPARIADRTISWNAIPAAAGSLTSAILAADAGLTVAHMAADVTRQFIQIGQVIDWWRPVDTVPVPSGFVVCDGQTVTAGNHSFAGVAGSITTPDLRNMFILGANTSNADASGASGADTAAGAPGIRGSGGSQRHTMITAEMPAHGHSASDSGHAHQIGFGAGWNALTFSGDPQGYYVHAGGDPANPQAVAGTDYTRTGGASIGIGSTGGGGAHNNMPRYVGLLKLMKVKWS